MSTSSSTVTTIPTINYNPATQQWHSLGLSPTELRPDVTLINGQTFTWQPVRVTSSKGNVTDAAPVNEWAGVLDEHVLHIRQLPDDTEYTIVHSHNSQQKDASDLQQHVHQQLLDYLWIEPLPHLTTTTEPAANALPLPTLASLYPQWSLSDKRFNTIAQLLPGVRLLRQNPLECLYSFICSSNNHIQRITKMLDSLRTQYGTKLCTVKYSQQSRTADGEQEERLVTFAMFPTLQQLSRATDQQMRDMGFGYRAGFVVKTTQQLLELGGEQWLYSLRTMDRKEVESLLESSLHGVGRKVASCVALFSCDQVSAVPIDTHMYQLVQKHYGMKSSSANKDNKAINARLYEEIGEIFRARFGAHAGWAHSVLFTAELRLFADKLGSASKHHKSASARKPKASESTADDASPALKRAASQPIFQKVEALADEILPMLSDSSSSKENDTDDTNRSGRSASKSKRRASATKLELTSDFAGMSTPPRRAKRTAA